MPSNLKGESRTVSHRVLGAALAAFGLLAVASASRASAGPILTRGPRRVAPLPAPVNLTNTLTKDVCTAHGGSAGSLACAIALPAGKLVLVWDYPYHNAIDGFRVYRVGGGLVATQSLPSVHLAVLDAQPAGACFDVTAFHGKDESAPSPTQYCVRAVDIPKTARFQPDTVGSAIADYFVWADKSVLDNEHANRRPFIRDLLTLTVGHSHVATLFRDKAQTQVSQYTNSIYRGYLHFRTRGLTGHQVSHASLRLSSRGASTACVSQAGTAGQPWRPGQWLALGNPLVEGGPFQGPDITVDVTRIVQAWADSPGANQAFALGDGTIFASGVGVVLSTSCVTTFSSAVLNVTYY
jgi:hypothetical protein